MAANAVGAVALGICVPFITAGCSFLGQDEGVSVTFPDGWETSKISPSAYREARQEAAPEIDQFPGDEVSAITVGWDPDGPSACAVFDGPERENLDFVYWTASWEVISRTARSLERDPDQEPGWMLTSSDDLMLPSGPAMFIGAEQPKGPAGVQYKVTDGDRSFVVVCYAQETPPDRWRSIAETVEFLPAR